MSEEYKFSLTIDGVEFMTGDIHSTSIIFFNLTGRNFDEKKHDEYLSWLAYMEGEFKTKLPAGARIEQFSPSNESVRSGLVGESAGIKRVLYVSEWEEGVVETKAVVDLNSGVVAEIEMSDEGEEFEHLIREYISTRSGNVTAGVELSPDNNYRITSLDELAALRDLFGFVVAG